MPSLLAVVRDMRNGTAKWVRLRGSAGVLVCLRTDGSHAAAGTGSAVTDLIFSIAKREVTFFSGTAPISFL